MDPAFAAYGYGIMGLGGTSAVGSGDSASNMSNNDSGGGSESIAPHIFQGQHRHSQNSQNLLQDLGQQQSANQTVGGIHHHISSSTQHNHSHNLGQTEQGNGNNHNRGTSTSVQIPQGTFNFLIINPFFMTHLHYQVILKCVCACSSIME